MTETPALDKASTREHWGSRFGVILAVAGSAVGLGNFLRFPGTAVNNGGGAFLVPYFISFVILGIPIAWCEWTIGRLGGRFGQNNGPGIMYALSRNALGRFTGALTLAIPVLVYMYYVILEALCLRYSVHFFSGGFAELFATANEASTSIVGASSKFTKETVGMNENGGMYGNAMLWLILLCFLVNFVIIYRGVTKGIEKFCIAAMPLLILCAVIVLVRVLTLDNEVDGRTIGSGLGFMWNPDWGALRNPEVWLRAAGQIFFSLSVGFGLILCYSSYLRKDDDVVLTSLSASSTNEFCEVILGGMIVVPAAFLFLGPGNTPASTFALGFFTVPAIMYHMPGGSFFGGMWFGLLFLAAVTSSISMLQPAIAFLEDGFGLKRRTSVTILGVFTTGGAAVIMYFSKNLQALDFTDFWCEFMMILAGLGQVIIFGWIIGAKRGVEEMNRGSVLRTPRLLPFFIRFVTPTFLIVVLSLWCYYNAPSRLEGMSPTIKGQAAARTVYAGAVAEHFADEELAGEALAARVTDLLGQAKGIPETLDGLPGWLRVLDQDAEAKRADAAAGANVARYVFVAVILLLILILAVSDIAYRNRIGRSIEQSGIDSGEWGTSS